MSSITLEISDETVAALDDLAQILSVTRSSLVADALDHYLAQERRWIEDITTGLAECRRGESVAHDEVMAAATEAIKAAEAKRTRKARKFAGRRGPNVS